VTPVWLHGWPLDERQWQRQAARFGGTAVRLYARGSSIDGWAQQILEELAGDNLALVGCSMGGYTALAMARRAPERVASIVLAPSKAEPDSPERRAFRDRLIEQLRRDGPPEHAYDGISVDELVAAQEAIRDRDDTTDVVATFPRPFVACAGTEDDLVHPDEARALAALAPNGRAEVFAGAGHFINLDDPDGIDELLESVLR
jgi:pimeloyl-ACP methyl ester carboxylesterase